MGLKIDWRSFTNISHTITENAWKSITVFITTLQFQVVVLIKCHVIPYQLKRKKEESIYHFQTT